MKMNLVIDFGNTRIKAALFDRNKLTKEFVYPSLDELKQADLEYNSVIISNVSYPEEKLRLVFPKAIFISPELKMPFTSAYETPHTLGVDRLALSAGALSLNQSTDLLIIDMGTCITYDFIEKGAIYNGGAISAGVQLRAKALHNFTHKLPLVETIKESLLVGNTTDQSIMSGLVNGVAFEIEGFISAYKQKHPDIKVFLSGGDAEFFESKIKQSIFVVPNLALLGLNKILQENINE
jgi:type III pantothenate kinase